MGMFLCYKLGTSSTCEAAYLIVSVAAVPWGRDEDPVGSEFSEVHGKHLHPPSSI